MILLIPIAIVTGLIGMGSTLYVWIQCASIAITPAVVLCVITALLYGLLVYLGIRKALKTDKPYYLVSIGIIVTVGLIMLAFQNQIINLFGNIFSQVSSGVLPNSQVN